MRCKKLLQISAGVFFMECSVRHLAPGLRIKTENKGFAGSEAQTVPALQREKENPGYGFAHQNGGQRVCGEPSANRAGAAAGKKENPGSGFAHQNGEQRVCGEPSANRAGAAAGKKENSGFGFAHQNGEQRVCGESSANPAGRKCSVEIINKKSRRLSLVNGGRRRRHIRIIQFYGAPETCGRGECVFLWGVKR